jgi:D-amino-acid dehydrogenase
MKICVLGAGITGLTAAYCLAKRGHDVTVVDQCSGPGQGASFGNGAQLSYAYVAPLADPSVWKNLPAYLLKRDSPLQWKPRFDSAQWQWLARFLQVCTPSASRSATAELLRLAFYSRACLQALQSELQLDFGLRTAGKLVMVDSLKALVVAERQVDFQRTLGCVQRIVTPSECVEIEPALAHAVARWAGGVYTPGEQVGDCAAFCRQLADAIRVRYPNTQFRFNTKLTGAVVEHGRVVNWQSDQDEVVADAYVLAMGAASAALAATLDLQLLVYPLKGYSVTLDATEGAPHVSITDLHRKVVYARIGNRLRVAGRVEIVGGDCSIDERKCSALVNDARELFPDLKATLSIDAWAGSRPATPTGIPIIGRSPVRNVFINTGHGALGWTLACGSAQLLAHQIDGQPTEIADTAFRYAS